MFIGFMFITPILLMLGFIPPILLIGFIPPIPIMLFMGVVEVGGILARMSLLVFIPIPILPPIFIPILPPMFMFMPS